MERLKGTHREIQKEKETKINKDGEKEKKDGET